MDNKDPINVVNKEAPCPFCQNGLRCLLEQGLYDRLVLFEKQFQPPCPFCQNGLPCVLEQGLYVVTVVTDSKVQVV